MIDIISIPHALRRDFGNVCVCTGCIFYNLWLHFFLVFSHNHYTTAKVQTSLPEGFGLSRLYYRVFAASPSVSEIYTMLWDSLAQALSRGLKIVGDQSLTVGKG